MRTRFHILKQGNLPVKRTLFAFIALSMVLLIGCDSEDNVAVSQNRPPTIAAVRAFPSLVAPAGLVTLICDARDNDSENFDIVWNSEHGEFEEGQLGVSVGWIAPMEEGVYIVNVRASDGEYTADGSVAVTVREGASTGQLMPLNIGNWWNYQVLTWVNDTLQSETACTITVDSTLTWDDFTWYRLAYDDEPNRGIYFRNNYQGLLALTIDADYPEGVTSIYYKYPAGVGERWTRTDSLSVKVERLEEELDVPYAHFEGCILYTEKRDDVLTGEVWMKQDYGYIKINELDEIDGDEVRVEWKLVDLNRE